MQSQHPSPQPQQSHIKAIGKVLITRRTAMDPAHHRKRDEWMETVQAATDLSKRTIVDVETGARASYGPPILTALEQVYRLQDGSLQQALQGGQLIAEDGQVLYPPPPPGAERAPGQGSETTARAMGLARRLEAATEGMEEDRARAVLRQAMDAAEAQARLILDIERQAREGSPKKENS